MRKSYLSLLQILITFTLPTASASGWICSETASKRDGNDFLVCGVGEASTERGARERAFLAAQREFEMICSSSSDCRDKAVSTTPLRMTCEKLDYKTKCYRAVQIRLLDKKRQVINQADIDRVDDELEKTRIQFEEARRLHKKQKEILVLNEKIQRENFGINGRFKHEFYYKTNFGFGLAQFLNASQIDGLEGESTISLTLSGEYLTGKLTKEYYFAGLLSDTVTSLTFWLLQKYYLNPNFSISIGSGLNYNHISSEDILAEDGTTTQTEIPLVSGVSLRISDNVYVELLFSKAIYRSKPTLLGQEVPALDRLMLGLAFCSCE